MKSNKTPWSKDELHIYILLLCASADKTQSKEELDFIKSKTTAETFQKMYEEFAQDTEDEGLSKIDENVQLHYLSTEELNQLHIDMRKLFFIDKKFDLMERNLERILSNIIY